eukprot:CAMPEP_0194066328 /NCGR_PEP_ID=MMETSP0009_2-20130614/85956_1 /TAXON_ID=210454 /ORGANISM="Grammatophora oceanica, Strain CCMP 410" /LENGTH=78 /DNA_ID=CAMNT_0038719263 /DNA_START=1379 /DNA_END=1615 /DNA_ORIENTATION=-
MTSKLLVLLFVWLVAAVSAGKTRVTTKRKMQKVYDDHPFGASSLRGTKSMEEKQFEELLAEDMEFLHRELQMSASMST